MKFVSQAMATAALAAGLSAPGAAWSQATSPDASHPTKAAPSSRAASSGARGPTVTVQTVAMHGKVTAIDPAHRIVTLEDKDGHQSTMVVGPDIRNFENLKVGDRVNARFTEAESLALVKGEKGNEKKMGELRTKVESDAARQAAGGKPGLSAFEQTTMVANVFQIDRQRGVLTLRGTDGAPVDIKVPDKQTLNQIGINDQVVIGYRRAAAVSIEPG